MSEAKKTSGGVVRIGRYDLVSMARDWITAMKDTEEYRNWGQSEMVKQAIDEVRSGRMNAEDIEKALAAKRKSTSAAETGDKKPEKDTAKSEK